VKHVVARGPKRARERLGEAPGAGGDDDAHGARG
jgi:hypothetical protein